jgi:hypothetical protein
MADRRARRGKGAKKIWPLPSSFSLQPSSLPAPFPRLQNVKEQARERRTRPTIPRFDGNATKKFIFPVNGAECGRRWALVAGGQRVAGKEGELEN